MVECIYLKERKNLDVELLQIGYEYCRKGHAYGPAVRDFYLLHYVLSGEGVFVSKEVTYELKKDDAFLIFPEQLTYYQADNDNPWGYVWLAIIGDKADALYKAAGFSMENPVITGTEAERFFVNMNNSRTKREKELIILSEFYAFIAHMAQKAGENKEEEGKSVRREYVSEAINFIKNNYMSDIRIGSIADHIGLNRSYFSEIFRFEMGVSPKQYLITQRMERACDLLRRTNLSIADLARSVGYNDELLFSRMFSKKKGISPSHYRKIATQQTQTHASGV